jgi:hypothetical protein
MIASVAVLPRNDGVFAMTGGDRLQVAGSRL